jgi:dimethylargininase
MAEMHRFRHAIVRAPGRNFAAGLTTVAWSEPPSFERLCAQHGKYVEALREAGLTIEILPALEGFPDAYFVEDVAIVLPELAIVTRPGAASRYGEAEHIVGPLAAHRRLVRLEPPATLDGGDVLVVDKQVFVGLSARSNAAAVASLRECLAPLGYIVTAIPVAAGLHLKSSLNLVRPGTLVATPDFAGRPEFAKLDVIELSAAEAAAANVVRINDRLLVPAGYPGLVRRCAGYDVAVIELDMSEVAKMDGGLTCLSLRL